MGFSLEQMIADLEDLISFADQPSGLLLELKERLHWWKVYAQECGKIT